MIAIDTNLLVYAHRQRVPQHRAARTAIERVSADPRGWGIPLPCVAEFWSVVTHPDSEGGPSTPTEATEFLGQLLGPGGARLWYPREGFRQRLLALASDLDVAGFRIFDLQIALTAFDGGATEIWTHDAQFVSPAGLGVIDPLD